LCGYAYLTLQNTHYTFKQSTKCPRYDVSSPPGTDCGRRNKTAETAETAANAGLLRWRQRPRKSQCGLNGCVSRLGCPRGLCHPFPLPLSRAHETVNLQWHIFGDLCLQAPVIPQQVAVILPAAHAHAIACGLACRARARSPTGR